MLNSTVIFFSRIMSGESVHKLVHPWRLICSEPKSKTGRKYSEQDWRDSLKEVATFNSVEDFWAVYVRTAQVYDISNAGYRDIYLFREDFMPVYEDERLKGGGTFQVNVKKRDSAVYWENLLLSLIGNNMHENIVGTAFSSRRQGTRISLWCTASNEDVMIQIVKDLQNVFELPFKSEVQYREFRSDDVTASYGIEANGITKHTSDVHA